MLWRGCHPWAVIKYLRSRHYPSQVMLPRRPSLLFLTSIPYTYGQYPWVIEIEDATTLFYPFIQNGLTAELDLARSPYLRIVRTVLESSHCRGIITHIRSTAEALPRMFGSDSIRRKVHYLPLGMDLPAAGQRPRDDEPLELLFTCSWHQNPESFYLRGGLEVLDAFDILQERYPQLRLTLRTGLPALKRRYRRIIERRWVRVIDRYLQPWEMDDLMRRAHLFLLPAARIHIVSLLKAMAYGQAAVVSDGWGFSEYVNHEHNGMIVPGRYGVTSWEDPETGMLREDYEPMHVSSPIVVQGLVEAISTLVEDTALRRALGQQARQDIAQRYNLQSWNEGLIRVLDQALKP
jgi:glycosyltransferase involved in cell wall biosynthesis